MFLLFKSQKRSIIEWILERKEKIMFEKLELVEKRYDELNSQISDPEVISNQSEWQKLMKEHASIEDIVLKFREYKQAKQAMDEAKEMMEDKELKELAEMEYYDNKEQLPKLEEELKFLLKFSRLHIGPEGGMIHLRHALSQKPSCVLFGPTSYLFYGYPENLNLYGEGCISQCEWCTSNWQDICLRNETSVCEKLKGLHPDVVFEKIVNKFSFLE